MPKTHHRNQVARKDKQWEPMAKDHSRSLPQKKWLSLFAKNLAIFYSSFTSDLCDDDEAGVCIDWACSVNFGGKKCGIHTQSLLPDSLDKIDNHAGYCYVETSYLNIM